LNYLILTQTNKSDIFKNATFRQSADRRGKGSAGKLWQPGDMLHIMNCVYNNLIIYHMNMI